MTTGRRRAGLLVPLSSIPSSGSWGIGEIGDIPAFARWMGGAGQSVLQLLPINEMAPGDRSPYSALSAMAIDPLYIGVDAVEDFQAAGGRRALSAENRALLVGLQSRSTVDHASVRRLKDRALGLSFTRFRDGEWSHASARADRLRAFMEDEAWWLDEYALFRAIHASEDERPWTAWPIEIRERHPGAMAAASQSLGGEIFYHQYLQWIASEQWQAARAAARPVSLFGDLPFVVAIDSADVWSYQHEFRLDTSVGVPPDAFSEVGQDWQLPLYRWDVMRERGDDWQRERARRMASLYDGYRIDHVVGFFRTYARPRDGSAGSFWPAAEGAQIEQGERLMTLFRDSGAEIIAEDLGTVPEFVRAALTRLGLPGYRVLRWERRWTEEGRPFLNPATYPSLSVATSGTHDTETLAVWWDALDPIDRAALLEIPSMARLAAEHPQILEGTYREEIRDVLLGSLFDSGSDLMILPIQDVFGWRDRINEPATVTDENWTFRVPWPVDRFETIAEARDRQGALRRLSESSQRSP